MIQTSVKGYAEVIRALNDLDSAKRKAAATAIQVEVYRLYRELKSDVRAGNPGGSSLQALSMIARRTKAGRVRKNIAPLNRLAKLIRYNIESSQDGVKSQFGFADTRSKALTGTWKSLIIQHAEGSRLSFSGRTELGIRLARIGGKLKKRGEPDAQFFFLRKRTLPGEVDLPTREIIQRFWSAHQDEARVRIVDNFERKLRGERI